MKGTRTKALTRGEGSRYQRHINAHVLVHAILQQDPLISVHPSC